MKVFMSYAREDYDTAKKLYDDLTEHGVGVWLDKEELLPGQYWKPAISRAIRESSHFLALFSEHSITKRGYFQRELKKAMDVLEDLPEYEIYFIPVRLDTCEPKDEKLRDIHWADLFPDYDGALRQILRVLKPAPDGLVLETANQKTGAVLAKKKDTVLRKEPISVSKENFLSALGLDKNQRPLKYVENKYEADGDGTITDHATGLMWQQSGSEEYITHRDAEAYVEKLNQNRFAGHDDWRLPTTSELMSLLEPDEQANGLYIDPLFDKEQSWCWTADHREVGGAVVVYFTSGLVDWSYLDDNNYARVVRSGQ